MSTQALYRKYRSSDFTQVLGQPQVVETLQRAISADRISHAYLFTGPRGTGKTSVARLLARAVNCTGKTKPCGTCDICKIDISSHLDLIEIDAASNRRIDEIRELRDKVHLAPSIGRYKVYIIDEVHMLTNEAANALLKTLEEPPAHVIFILATTEAHKLPSTIISRTQRFNFKPIQQADLVAGLKRIAEAEQIQADAAALELLATASRGGFRDAISLLDQAAGPGESITAANVRALLGWAEQDLVDQIVVAVENAQPAAALKLIDQATAAGAPPQQLLAQLLDRYRQLMLVQAGAAETRPETIFSQLAQANPRSLARAVDTLAATAKSPWPEIALETAVIQLSLPETPTAKPKPATARETSPGPVNDAIPTSATSDLPGDGNPPPVSPASSRPPTSPVSVAPPLRGDNKPSEQAGERTGDLWMKTLATIKAHNNSLYALLRSCDSQVEGDRVVVICRFNFHRERISEPKNRQLVEQALERAYGRPLQLVAQVKAVSAPVPASPGTELVSTALEILGGEVIDG